MCRFASACFAGLLAAVAASSCRAPTEITLFVSTDAKCADLRGTSITVGRLGEIETKPATTSSTFCDPSSGDLGALVVVPSGGKRDEVAIKVVGALGRDLESCAPPYGKGCIVARRAIHYVPETPLRIQVPLRAACDGVPCGETETCVSGACAPATIADPGTCSGAAGCGEGALDPARSSDAGAATDARLDAETTDAAPDAAPPAPALAVVQSSAAGGNALTLAVPIQATRAGDLVAVSVVQDSSPTVPIVGVTDDAPGGSNTYVTANQRAVDSSCAKAADIWYAKNVRAGATLVTVTLGRSGPLEMWATEIAGASATDPLYTGAAASAQPLTSTIVAPTVTPSTPNALVLSVAASCGSITGIAPNSPFQPLGIENGRDSAYYVATALGTYGAVWTVANTATWCGSTVAFK